jgi:hypothetical protein
MLKFLLQHQFKTYPLEGLYSYYFDARGTAWERTTSGFYRYILYQVMTKGWSLEQKVTPQAIEHHERNGWSLDVLKDLYRDAIHGLMGDGKGKITCYVDALDEYKDQNDTKDMVSFLEEMTTQATSECWQLHICLGSRHYLNISMASCEELNLDDDPRHDADVVTYVSNKLRVRDRQLKQRLTNDIKARASGVFLWVVMVVKILNEKADSEHRFRLRETLENIPSGLDDLFNDILDQGEVEQEFLPAIQRVLNSWRPLEPLELRLAILISTSKLTEGELTFHAVRPQNALVLTSRSS